MKTILSLLFLMLVAALRSAAETRVALVSTCGGEAGQNVLALADAALSAETNIVLVERREIERVLQEQKLMHCGLSEARQAVTVGRLLGVQVFASLETVSDEKDALGLVVFDAATGVELWNSVVSGTNAAETATEVDAAVKIACEKRQRPVGGLTTVCILSVRNADLPRDLDSLCASVGGILQRRLVQSPSLAVLERQYLEHVNRERSLPMQPQPNQLLTSLVMIELEVGRGSAAKSLTATASLSDNTGAKLGKATAAAESGNAADLSDRLMAKLERLLKAAPPQVVVDRAREAERFAREARFLTDSGDLLEGLRAIEAANALTPTNANFQEQLVKCLGLYASARLGGTPTRDDLNYSLDLGLRGLEISRAFDEQALARENTVRLSGPEGWLKGYYLWDRVLLVANDQDADTTRKILEFQRRCRELLLDVLDRQARARVRDPQSFRHYTDQLYWWICDIERFAPTSSIWTTDTLNSIQHWLKMTERFPLDWGDRRLGSARMLARLCEQAKGPWRYKGPWANTWIHHIGDWKLQPNDYARLDELFDQMKDHPDPVVHAYGLAGQLSATLREAMSISVETDRQYQTAKGFLRSQITMPGREPASVYRMLLYNAALDLIDLLPDPQTRQREYQELFEFMLERKEIEYWVTRMVTDPHLHAYRHYNTSAGYGGTFDIFPDKPDPHLPEDCTPLIANAHRVLTLLRSGEGHDIDTMQLSHNTGSFERELIWIQRDIKTESDSRPSVPWENAKLLFPLSAEPPGGSIISVATDSNAFYVVLSGTRLRVVRVPLTGGQAALLGEALYRGRTIYGVPKVSIPAIGERKVFVGTDKGIFVFPLDGGTAQHITTAEGLSTDDVSSLACVDGKVYGGLDGGYLISYDLKTRGCQVLVSSRRHDIRCGLDNVSPPPIINFMIPDPERHRVLFTVSLGINVACVPQLGLWQIDTTTERVTQLVQLYSQPVWAGLTGDGTVLIRFSRYGGTRTCGGSDCGVVSYELETGRTRLLSDCGQEPAGPQIPAPAGVLRMPWSADPPHALIDGWLWFADGRVSTNAEALEYFPASKETQGHVPFEWKSFHLLGNHGRMAIAGPGGIWLLTLKTHETSVDATKDSP